MSLWGENLCPTCYNKLWLTDLIFNAFSPTFFVCVPSLFEIKNIEPSVNLNPKARDDIILPFNTPKVRALKRIGPHNYEIFSIIFGSLLGDGFAEKHGEGTRICFQQEGSHAAYLLWFHNSLSKLGYCSKTDPKLSNRLALHGKIRKILRFKTFTFSSFNWIEECFYKKDICAHLLKEQGQGIIINGSPLPFVKELIAPPGFIPRIKVLPSIVGEYLSPLALAIWIMDDGGKVSGGLKLSTNNFTEEEVLLLRNILNKKFGLKVTIQSAGVKRFNHLSEEVNKNQYILYVSKTSMSHLIEIVGPYLHPSMKYKLNGYL
jgi:ubiquinol-cytochrome c reductase cytochrome b subunit